MDLVLTTGDEHRTIFDRLWAILEEPVDSTAAVRAAFESVDLERLDLAFQERAAKLQLGRRATRWRRASVALPHG